MVKRNFSAFCSKAALPALGSLTHPKLKTNYAPGSSPLNIILVQAMIEQAVALSLKQGQLPPIFKSGNVAGGYEYNKTLFKKYGKRVPPLK